MKRQNILITITVFAISMALNAQKMPTSNLILFTVNSNPVTVDEFVYLYRKNHEGKSEEFTKSKIEEYLNLFINFKLKVAEAESRKMDSSNEFVKELNTYKEELKKPFTAETDVLNRLVTEVYNRLKQEIKASHILINVGPDAKPADTLKAYLKANEIRGRIINGESFEALAREFSEDPSVKTNGGSLGYFSALQMVFPFEEAAYNLEVGEISRPTRTRFGYHLIKIEDKRASIGEVEVSHILLRGADDNNKKLIFEVYDQLKAGGDWNEICGQYSQDPGTKDKSGRLKPFGSGALATAPEFEAMAFSLNDTGSISEPVQTPYGWHIIRLERKIPLPPLEELRPSLERRVSRDERMTISKTKASLRRKNKFDYKEDPSLKFKLELMTDSSIVSGTWTLGKTKANGGDRLFSIGSLEFSLGDFANYIEKNQSVNNSSPKAYVAQLYDQFVEEALAEAEDVKLQSENPEYKNLVNEYREGILLFSIMEQEVWNKASEDSLGQRNYYETNVDDYKAGPRIEARLYSTRDKEFLKGIKEKIEKGDSLFSNEVKKFNAISNFRAYERGEHKVVDSIGWTIGLHEAEADGMYYLVEVSRLVAPGEKKFEEVRASVISDYQDQLEKEWISKLKEKYPIKVNAKNKKKAIAELILNEKS